MSEEWGKGKTIALVDDSIDFASNVRRLLAKSHFKGGFKAFPFAKAFYQSLDEFAPTMVLCDLSMPGDSGLDVKKHLDSIGYEGCFILITGDTEVFDMTFDKMPDFDIMIKPPEVELFIERIKRCLK